MVRARVPHGLAEDPYFRPPAVLIFQTCQTPNQPRSLVWRLRAAAGIAPRLSARERLGRSSDRSCVCLRPGGAAAQKQRCLVDEAESVAVWIEAVERSLAPRAFLDRRYLTRSSGQRALMYPVELFRS